jgi:hypothetical protein
MKAPGMIEYVQGSVNVFIPFCEEEWYTVAIFMKGGPGWQR